MTLSAWPLSAWPFQLGPIMGGVQGYYTGLNLSVGKPGQAFPVSRVPVTAVAGGLASEVSGGSFRDGALISGGISLVTYGALKMREYEIAHSPKSDLGRDSVGFNGSNDSLAGSRTTQQTDPATGRISFKRIPLPFGGNQGQQGTLFRAAYARASWQDYLLEAYGGPHDFLGRPWGYNALGYNDAPGSLFGRVIANVAGATVANRVSDVMAGVDLFLATPIVAASVVGISPGATTAVIQSTSGHD